jgi:hypothetical protein
MEGLAIQYREMRAYLKSMNAREVPYLAFWLFFSFEISHLCVVGQAIQQGLNLAMIVFSALMIWRGFLPYFTPHNNRFVLNWLTWRVLRIDGIHRQ